MAEANENPGAALVRKRWDKATKEQRLEASRIMVEARRKKAKERAKRAKKKARKKS